MSRYISKLPPEIRELAERRRIEQNPNSKNDELAGAFDFTRTKEGFEFWMNINYERYQPFFTLYPQDKNCTCNSRTVDETFSNVVHSTDCELYESKHQQKDKLDELIEWMEDRRLFSCLGNSEFSELEHILNKAKEIKDGK